MHGEGLVRHRGGLQLLHRAAAVLEAHADLSICVEIFSAVTIRIKLAEKVKSAVRRSSALGSVLALVFSCCKPMEFGLRCAWCEKTIRCQAYTPLHAVKEEPGPRWRTLRGIGGPPALSGHKF